MKPIKFSVSWPQQKPRLRFEICRALKSNQDLSYSGGASTGQIFFLKIGEALRKFPIGSDQASPPNPGTLSEKKCPPLKKVGKCRLQTHPPFFDGFPFSKQKKID